MVAEEYLSRSRLFRNLKSGPHGHLVELYAARLVKDGFARQGTWRCLSLVDDLLSWITRSRSNLTDLNERMVERYLRHRAAMRFILRSDRAALKRLLSVLRDAGMIAPAALLPITRTTRSSRSSANICEGNAGWRRSPPRSACMPISHSRKQPWQSSRRTGVASQPASSRTIAFSPFLRRCKQPTMPNAIGAVSAQQAENACKRRPAPRAVRHSSADGIASPMPLAA